MKHRAGSAGLERVGRSIVVAVTHALPCWAVLAFAASAEGQLSRPLGSPNQGSAPTATSTTQIRVLPDRASVAPGESFNIAVLFEIQRDWHLYWKNPGAGAMAPDVRVSVPDEFRESAIRWPRPAVLPSSVGDMYGYEDRFMLLVPITAPDSFRSDSVPVELDIAWAVCDKNMCLFGRKSAAVMLSLQSDAVDSSIEPKLHPLVQELESTLPLSADASGEVSVRLLDEQLIVEAPARGFREATFFPHQSPGVNYGDARIETQGDRLIVTVPLEINPANFEDGRPNIGGLLALGTEPSDPSYEFTVPLSSDATQNRAPS